MSELTNKWLFKGSLITIFVTILGFIAISLVSSEIQDNIGAIAVVLILLSLINIFIYFSIKYQDNKIFRIVSKVSTYLFPLFLSLALLYSRYNQYGTIIVLLSVISGILTIGNIFILNDLGEIKFSLIMVFCIVLAYTIDRITFYSFKIKELAFMVFVFSTMTTGGGMYVYGIRCLIQIKKNTYLKVFAFLTCVLIAFGSIVFILKVKNDLKGDFDLLYFVPSFLITLIVLFSLPMSGFINWSSLHKRILKRIAVIWVFLLFVFSISLVFPDFYKNIVGLYNKVEIQEFNLVDYKIQNKNGLEPE